jgi:hypothetical protein
MVVAVHQKSIAIDTTWRAGLESQAMVNPTATTQKAMKSRCGMLSKSKIRTQHHIHAATSATASAPRDAVNAAAASAPSPQNRRAAAKSPAR